MTPEQFGMSWKEVVGLISMFAFMWYELKAIRRAIMRLETKVEKHNNFDRRIIRLETLLEIKGDNNAKV